MNKYIMIFIISCLLAACDSAPREIRSRIGDLQERESYKSFLDSRGQDYKELPDGTIVIIPDSPAEGKLLEEAIEKWHIDRANIAAVFLLFITIACRAGDKEPAFIFPDRTPDEIIKNIKPFLNENNIQLDQYTLESISYDYMKSRWHVSYSGKSLAIGDHFSIVVGDNLKEIKLIPGL